MRYSSNSRFKTQKFVNKKEKREILVQFTFKNVKIGKQKGKALDTRPIHERMRVLCQARQ